MKRRLAAQGAVAWIFQANPDDWRINDYLAATVRDPGLRDTVWEVKPESYGEPMNTGQRVYIWRAAGLGKHDARPRQPAGIVARGHITGPAGPLADTQIEFRWRSRDPKFEGEQFRVPVRLEDVLRGQLDREQLGAQEPLEALSILRWARQRTTYPVFAHELPVIERMFSASDLVT